MRGFLLALQFLTRLPAPAVADSRAEELQRSVLWFPAVGLILGGLLAGVWWLAGHFDPWLAALFTLIAWVWATGALHLDGLSDLFDALGAAHRDRQRFLQVLADPHLGSFGAIALILQLAAKLVLLSLAAKQGVSPWALVLIPAWARLGALWWSQSLPPLKPGLGERFSWRKGRPVPLMWLAILVMASLPFPGLLLAPLALWSWHRFLRVKVGGMSGDCLGAGVEVVESLLLLALVSMQGL